LRVERAAPAPADRLAADRLERALEVIEVELTRLAHPALGLAEEEEREALGLGGELLLGGREDAAELEEPDAARAVATRVPRRRGEAREERRAEDGLRLAQGVLERHGAGGDARAIEIGARTEGEAHGLVEPGGRRGAEQRAAEHEPRRGPLAARRCGDDARGD